MNKKTGVIIGAIMFLAMAGGVYASTTSVSSENDAMMAKKQMEQKTMESKKMVKEKAMMKKKAMEKKRMMEKKAMMKKEGTSADKMNDQKIMGVGILLKNGAIMLEESGKMSPLTKEYVFETGVKVSLIGQVMKKDGTTIQLKEGESAWADGTVMKAESDSMMKKDETSMTNKADTMMKAGSYEAYGAEKMAMASSTHNVVLFFRASWCPTCISVDKDIKANLGKIPSSLTILDVNYDNSSELKKKYGVTYQHTFVQVDKDGNMIKKWSGSPTLTALVKEVK